MNVRSLPVAGTLAMAALVGPTMPQVLAGGLQPQGGEFQLTRGVPGDQVRPALILNEGGGWLVWQDAAVDGDGLGIAATRLTEGATAVSGASIKVNGVIAGDQENPAITEVGDRGLFVVWQGGVQGFQRIAGRVLKRDGTFATGEFGISSGRGEHQIDPALATLADGSVVVVWSSFRQDESYSYDVYARRFTASGEAIAEEYRVNATSGMNRRSATVTALPTGGFLVGWIAERQAGVRTSAVNGTGVRLAGGGAPVYEVSVVARAFDGQGQPVGLEHKVSDIEAIASNPEFATTVNGQVLAAWTRRDPSNADNGLDVASRLLSPGGVPQGDVQLLNPSLYGDQFRPRLSVTRHGVLAAWSSMGQDGSWEGVYGRWVDADGKPSGDEIPINGQTGGGQLFPTIASDKASNLLVAWSSNLPRLGYELFAQRFAPLLLQVESAGDGQLRLSWPTVSGGVYQVQASRDGQAWGNVGGTKAALADSDSVELSVSGQVVLYRVLRAR